MSAFGSSTNQNGVASAGAAATMTTNGSAAANVNGYKTINGSGNTNGHAHINGYTSEGCRSTYEIICYNCGNCLVWIY